MKGQVSKEGKNLQETFEGRSKAPFSLISLPYKVEELEPVISRQTISIHHGKHLAAYVNNLNALLPGSGFEEETLEEIVFRATGGIQNNAGQILNHELYFGQFASPKEDNAPMGKLDEAIVRDFGSFEAFKETFQKAGATLFGSGCCSWFLLSLSPPRPLFEFSLVELYRTSRIEILD